MWTNTCCSHPLAIPGETGDKLSQSIDGVRRAAQRKLQQELGIQPDQVPFDDFHFLTRIHYMAPSNGKWGEHEGMGLSLSALATTFFFRRTLLIMAHVTRSYSSVDYILFIKADVDLDVNPNEVRDSRYVSADEMRAMLQRTDISFTPWFRLIRESLLFEWWQRFDKGVEGLQADELIRRM